MDVAVLNDHPSISPPIMTTLLTINSGSSSLKFAVFGRHVQLLRSRNK